MKQFVLALLTIALLEVSCKTVRQTKTRIEGERTSTAEVLQKLQQPDIPYKWFFAKAKIQIVDSKNDNTLNAVIRMKKDSVIWISLNAILGIEVSRILITPDSVKLIDKFNKRYYNRPFSYVQQITGMPQLSFSLLQKIIMGNDMNMDLKTALIEKTDTSYQIRSTENQIQNIIWVNALNFTMAKKTLTNKVINQSYEMNYTDYRLLTDKLFSYKRHVRLAAKEVYTISIEYQKVTIDEPQKFNFYVPEKYLEVKPTLEPERK
jgi:hypothetical protein